MAQTQIPAGHALARKVFGAAIFAEVTRKNSFSTRLTAPAPKQGQTERKLKSDQSSPDYPFVRITDLNKGEGDTVSVDLFNILQGKPTMGDRKISGNMMALENDSMDIKIDQMRGGVDVGGRMTQHRTVHKLRTIGRAGLTGWWVRALDQLKLIHASGGRGAMDTADWVIPLDTDADYSKIVVNSVVAPTYNRHFYAGDATSIDTIDETDILTLNDIDKLRAAVDEADVPLQPIVLEGDAGTWDEPLYVLYVSSRQWHYLQNRTGASAWRTFLQNARERSAKNPLFSGDPGLWNGILVKKMQRVCRYNENDTATVATSADSFATETKTVGASWSTSDPVGRHGVDRALLFGAQAVAEVWGKDSETGTHMRWWEEQTDHGNTWEASVAGIGGCAKLRFQDANGVDTDHGIMVLDSYAPDPRYITVA